MTTTMMVIIDDDYDDYNIIIIIIIVDKDAARSRQVCVCVYDICRRIVRNGERPLGFRVHKDLISILLFIMLQLL